MQKAFLIVLTLASLLSADSEMRPAVQVSPTANGTVLTFDFSHIEVLEWAELLSDPDLYPVSGYGISGNLGDAALPVFTRMLPLDETGTGDIEIIHEDYRILEAVSLKEVDRGHLETEPLSARAEFNWQRPDSYLRFQIGEVQHLAEQALLPVSIRPILLDHETRSVSALRSLSVFIPGLHLDPDFQVDQNGQIRSIATPDDIFGDLGHYLIITNPTYVNFLDNLVTWKQRKGYEVSVVTTAETGVSASQIKSYVQTAYDTWTSRPDYLLLIGDEDQGMPAFYIQNPGGESRVTDHPYSLLEGDDVFPDLMVGRLSMDSVAQLLAIINKILVYESQPTLSDPDWFKRALMLCTITAAASPQDISNWVRRKLLENGYTQVDTVYYPLQGSISPIYTAVNNGLGFVNYRGLGAYNGWLGPWFDNGDLYGLNNGQMLPIVTSIVCGGGNFGANVDPCFGESWLRLGTTAVPRGSVAFFAPSELHTHTQFNNVINVGIYAAIFDNDVTELGRAMWGGKQELWLNYHQNQYHPFEQTPEFYMHVYNLLGDPGMQIWTDTPEELMVTHPANLNMSSDHVAVTVTNTAGEPVGDVFVYLYNEENALGRHTDASGSVSLPFNAGWESAVALTLTGTNKYPYLATIPVSSEEDPVHLDEWDLAGEGFLSAGGSHGFDITLTNGDQDLADVLLTISVSGSESVSVNEPVHSLGDLGSGETIELNGAGEISVDSSTPHADVVRFDLTLESGAVSWNWQQTLPVQAPQLVIQEIQVIEGELAAGDSARVGLVLQNIGGQETSELSLSMLEHPFVECEAGSLYCPPILIDNVVGTENIRWFHFSDQLFPGESVELHFLCQHEGRQDTLSIAVAIGELSRFAPSLPDDYGYRVFDDQDVCYSEFSIYDWIEIDPDAGGNGSVLPLNDTYEEADATTFLELPFPVQYYGESYAGITVCSNGWIAMGSSPERSFHNRRIPSPLGPAAMIAPYWDDLRTYPGDVISHTEADGSLFIVEWSRVTHLSYSNQMSFQVIFFNSEMYPTATGDNRIKFQYKDYSNQDYWANYSTTGIESPNTFTGIELSYNNLYDPSIDQIDHNRAYMFSTERGQRLSAPILELGSTQLVFEQNPWVINQDSFLLSNTGESLLIYDIDIPDEPALPPAPNPFADFSFTKGGSEPETMSAPREGTDEYGYTWRDENDEGGPGFNWVDIVGPEYELEYGDDPDDSSLGPFAIGFQMPFYDEIYSSLYISTNGTISFVSDAYPWANLPLPNSDAPPALLAPWWDDLNSDNVENGTIYMRANGIDSVIITYHDFPKWSTGERHTFQAILHSYGDITFQYLSMGSDGGSATVGIQNEAGSIGLTVSFNEDSGIDGGSAIRFSRPNNWFALSAWSGTIDPGESGTIGVTAFSLDLEPGNYSLPLTLISNSENLPMAGLEVVLNVVHGDLSDGDINADYRIDVGDLMLVLDSILGHEELDADSFLRADLWADGILDIRDAVLLVELILLWV